MDKAFAHGMDLISDGITSTQSLRGHVVNNTKITELVVNVDNTLSGIHNR